MCRSRRELSSEYLLAKFDFDTAENEPCKVCPLSAYRSPRFMTLIKEERGDLVGGVGLPEEEDRLGGYGRDDLVDRAVQTAVSEITMIKKVLILMQDEEKGGGSRRPK